MKMLILGDLVPTDVTDSLFDAMDIETLFTDTVSIFEGNDVGIANLECTLTDSDKPIEKYGPPLKACANTAMVMKKLGVQYFGFSNNHIFDYGIQGMKDTFAAVERAGITYTGFGENYEDSRKDLVIEQNGEKIAIIAVCEHEYTYALDDRMGSRPFDEFHTIEDIRKAKDTSDRVVVLYHGGKEHCAYPSPRLRRVCQAMARNGADVVICQHSHRIGSYEYYEDCHILYGQGNFHFIKPNYSGGQFAKTWSKSFAVKYDSKSHKMEFIPTVIEGNGIALAKGEEKEEIMSAFYQRNEELLDDRWKAGWHAFCENVVKDIYFGCVSNAYTEHSTPFQDGQFNHFLDCEAHTDVWRELFPTANMTNEK